MKIFCWFRYYLKFILILILFFSCQKKKDYKIEGKWIFVTEFNLPNFDKDGNDIPPLPPRENLGFNFYSKDSCEANERFFDLKSFDVDHYKVKLGRKTIFKIKNDTLLIFNRTLEKCDSYKILNIDDNNLTLLCNGRLIKSFAKKVKK